MYLNTNPLIHVQHSVQHTAPQSVRSDSTDAVRSKELTVLIRNRLSPSLRGTGLKGEDVTFSTRGWTSSTCGQSKHTTTLPCSPDGWAQAWARTHLPSLFTAWMLNTLLDLRKSNKTSSYLLGNQGFLMSLCSSQSVDQLFYLYLLMCCMWRGLSLTTDQLTIIKDNNDFITFYTVWNVLNMINNVWSIPCYIKLMST